MSLPLLAVNDPAHAYTILERVAEKRQGRYFMPGWNCPSVPDDLVGLTRFVDPEFDRQVDEATENIPKVAERLNKEYWQLRRDLEQAS